MDAGGLRDLLETLQDRLLAGDHEGIALRLRAELRALGRTQTRRTWTLEDLRDALQEAALAAKALHVSGGSTPALSRLEHLLNAAFVLVVEMEAAK